MSNNLYIDESIRKLFNTLFFCTSSQIISTFSNINLIKINLHPFGLQALLDYNLFKQRQDALLIPFRSKLELASRKISTLIYRKIEC